MKPVFVCNWLRFYVQLSQLLLRLCIIYHVASRKMYLRHIFIDKEQYNVDSINLYETIDDRSSVEKYILSILYYVLILRSITCVHLTKSASYFFFFFT